MIQIIQFSTACPNLTRLEAWHPVYGTVATYLYNSPPEGQLQPEMVSASEALAELTGNPNAVHPADWDNANGN